MMAKLDRTQQRRLAVGILAAGIVLLLSITLLPVWLANATRQASLDDAYERLNRYRQIAERDSELLPQYEALLRRQQATGIALRSDSAALAGAELQRLVKAIATRNSAQIVSTQILPVAEEQGFVRVALKVRVRGTLPAILQSFYDVETDSVYMFLDNVALRDNLAGRPGAREEVRPMDAEFDLVAYMPESS